MERGKERRVILDDGLHRLGELCHVESLFVDFEHREEVVHGGFRCVELIVDHV